MTASSALESRYADFLRNEKGLAELSLHVYLPVVDDLLHYLEKEHGTTLVRRLDASILRAFLFERARDRSSESVRLLATSLRSFLRFLHARGEIRHDLTAAIPTVRRWSQAGVPKKLTPEEVDRVLEVVALLRSTMSPGCVGSQPSSSRVSALEAGLSSPIKPTVHVKCSAASSGATETTGTRGLPQIIREALDQLQVVTARA